MKIITIYFLILNSVYANTNEQKTTSFIDQVVSFSVKDKNSYKLILMGHAAQYWAKNNHLTCIDTSIKSRQPVQLKVDAFTLEILDCQLAKK